MKSKLKLILSEIEELNKKDYEDLNKLKDNTNYEYAELRNRANEVSVAIGILKRYYLKWEL